MLLDLYYVAIATAFGLLVFLIRHFLLIRRNPSAPGPKLARFSDFWYLWKVWQGHFELYNIQAHDAEGPIVRVSPQMYSIDDLDAVNTIYGIGDSMPKTAWYTAWGDPKIKDHNLFSARDRPLHANMRRRVAHLYSMTSIKSYEPYVDNCIAILLEKFDHFAAQGQSIDLQRWMQSYAFDVVGEITFGNRMGFMESGGQDIGGTMHSLDLVSSFATLLGLSRALIPLWLAMYGFPVAGLMRWIETSLATMRENKYKPEGIAETFYEKLEKTRHTSPEDYKQYRLDNAMGANIGAGSDTTSVSLTTMMFHITKNRSVYTKLRQELLNAAAKGEIEEPIKFDQAQKLPYLSMVLKETLRIHPATGLPMWREVQASGATIAGTFFPPGSIVGINSWVACRSKKVFGPDADEFKPERWDPALTTPEKLARMERYHIPFGVGTRTCIGKNISILEMTKLIPELVRRYDFELLSKEMNYLNHWFTKQKDVRVKVSRVKV